MKSRILLVIFTAGVMILSLSPVSAAPQSHSYSWESNDHTGWLGVELQDVTKKLKEKKSLTVDKGAYIDEVVDDSPAEKAGLKEGDVIVKFNGKEIEDSDDLMKAVRKTSRDTEVKIEFLRKGDRKTVAATVGRAPRSYAYNFRMAPMPHMPSMPRMPKMPMLPRHGFRMYTSSDRMDGLELQELSRQLAEYFEVPDRRGVLVTDVEKGSDGEKAGFKAGDVIVKLDGSSIRSIEDLSEAIHEGKKGNEVPCDIVRKGKSVSLKWRIVSDEDEDDEDDDTSMNMITPMTHPSCEARVDRFQYLRDDLNRITYQLRERFHEMKSLIAEKISQIVDAVRNA